jgi:DNA-binding transcriptional LysR family regulator
LEVLRFAQETVVSYEKTLTSCGSIAKEPPPVRIRSLAHYAGMYRVLQEIRDIPFVFVDARFGEPLLKSFENNGVDVAFCYDISLVPDLVEYAHEQHLALVPLGSEDAAICFMRTHPLAKKGSLSKRDFRGCTVNIYSGRQFDELRQVAISLLGEESDLRFVLDPLESVLDLRLKDFGDGIYLSLAEHVYAHLSQRDDLVICTQVDGLELVVPSMLIYREDTPNGNVDVLVKRLTEGL